MGDYDINTDADKLYIKNLGGRTYMAGVSPWFFTVSKYHLLISATSIFTSTTAGICLALWARYIQ